MFVKVAQADEVQEGQPVVVEVGTLRVVIFRAQGQLFAMDNACPHRGGPLDEGFVEGLSVTCPWHAWQFDLKTGRCESAPGVTQNCYKVKVDGSDILIDIP